MLKVLNLNIDY